MCRPRSCGKHEGVRLIIIHVALLGLPKVGSFSQKLICLLARAQIRLDAYMFVMTKLPTLFVSHGAPNMILYASPARDFLTGLAATLPRPDAILVMSAHFETDQPVVVANAKPEMIYDFGGFERELYSMRYDAPGATALAVEAAALAQQAGLNAIAATGRGYDHGTWAPLKLIYPDADIPVAQISVQPQKNGAYHATLGRALAPLREKGVLILGSGGATHNLQAFFRGAYAKDAAAPAWVQDFDDWVCQKAEAGDLDAVAAYDTAAPFARENHPSADHYLPLPFAMGAAGEGAKGELMHSSCQYGVLMMDTYAFH